MANTLRNVMGSIDDAEKEDSVFPPSDILRSVDRRKSVTLTDTKLLDMIEEAAWFQDFTFDSDSTRIICSGSAVRTRGKRNKQNNHNHVK